MEAQKRMMRKKNSTVDEQTLADQVQLIAVRQQNAS